MLKNNDALQMPISLKVIDLAELADLIANIDDAQAPLKFDTKQLMRSFIESAHQKICALLGEHECLVYGVGEND